MSTGDLEGNLERLKDELRRTKYPEQLDEAGSTFRTDASRAPFSEVLKATHIWFLEDKISALGCQPIVLLTCLSSSSCQQRPCECPKGAAGY